MAPRTPPSTLDEPAAVEAPAVASPRLVPAAEGPEVSEDTNVGFAAGARFVVFARGGAASFTVFDREQGETFRVFGSPMGQPQPAFDPVPELGLATGALQWNLESDRSGRMLVRSLGGVQLVDLSDHGRMIAAFRGTPISASLAPDGKSFSVSTMNQIHVVRASDGAYASFSAPSDAGAPRWGERNVFFTADGKLTRVERATLVPTVFRADADGAEIATSSDATVVAIAAEGVVSIYAGSPGAPILRIPTANEIAQVLVDKDGRNVVWVERVIDEETFSDKGHLHAVDVAARTHVRFAMQNSGCGNAPETVESVDDGKITSDASCAIGCPSVRWTHRTVVYDAANGAVLEDESVAEERSWNEEQALLRSKIEEVAEKEGVAMEALMQHPNEDAFLVVRPSGLTLVRGSSSIALEGSEGAALGELTFSSDGTVVAGIMGDRARAWDTTTGRTLLR